MTEMTVSEVFAAADAAAEIGGGPGSASTGRARVRMRARGYRSLPVVDKIRDRVAVGVEDLRSAWWTPAALPTVQQAWAGRIPDRDTVPGGNAVLYAGWVVYNHTLGLAVPAVAVALVGLLTPLVWAARHPARLALALFLYAALFGPAIYLLTK